jgi:regulatory protein
MSDTYAKAKTKVLRLLARREYSVAEIIAKLKFSQFEETIISQVITDLQNKNWQSDYRCACMLLRYGVSQNNGPNKIKFSMQQKGIAEEIIDNVFDNLNILEDLIDTKAPDETADEDLDNYCFDYFWHKLVKSLAVRKFGDKLAKNNLETAVKLQRFLYNRGFELDHIKYVIKYFR